MEYATIKPYVEKGLVNEQEHPNDPAVRIFNYTPDCQFSGAWDDVTKQCRGLIMNVETGKVLAKPFPKFFNYSEHIDKGWPIPDELPQVWEKLDGSLGILYEMDGKPWIATRGSFESDQAVWATKWWRTRVGLLPEPNETNLFEIIYPENRIVVNYDYEGLVHLDTLDTETGLRRPRYWGGAIRNPATYSNWGVGAELNLKELAKSDEPNSEGFVIFFPKSNVRMKIKFANYVRLHKVLTGLSLNGIWEAMSQGKELELEHVPDEFYTWVKEAQANLAGQYSAIEARARSDYNEVLRTLDCEQLPEAAAIRADYRKAFALKVQGCKYPGIMFSMLDGRDYSHAIWRMVRPKGKQTYKVDIDL